MRVSAHFSTGHIDLPTACPHRKNPTIANVFSQTGIVEELGSGIRKMFKYTPLYSNGKEPDIEENDIYRIEIPYVPLFSLDSDTTQENGGTTQENRETTQENTQENAETTQETTQQEGNPTQELSDMQRDILEYLKTHPNANRIELSDVIKNASIDGIKYNLARLQTLGYLKRVGSTRYGHWEVVI